MKRMILIFLFFITTFSIFSVMEKKPKPVFILVHGSWHGAWCWYELDSSLRDAGYKVIVPDLPGHGRNFTPFTGITLDTYRMKLVSIIDRLTDNKVILVGHSMGGIVISEAAESRPHRVQALVYLSAFLLKDGQSLLEIAKKDTGSLVLPNLIINELECYAKINPGKIKEIFYNESHRSHTSLARKILRYEPLIPLSQPVHITKYNFGSVNKYYIFTTLDYAITPKLQHYMVSQLPCNKTYTIQTDHSPFFSAPVVLKNILLEIAQFSHN